MKTLLKKKLLLGLFTFVGWAAMAQTFTTSFLQTGDGCTNLVNCMAKNSADEIFSFWRDGSQANNNSQYYILKWSTSTNSWTQVSTFDMAPLQAQTVFDYPSDDVSLAIDASGGYHVVFQAIENAACCGQRRGIVYGYSANGSTWTFTALQQLADPNGWMNVDEPTIKLDASGNPHVVYKYYDVNGTRYYAVEHRWFDGSSWQFETVLSQTGTSNEVNAPDFDIAPNGDLHVACIRELDGSGTDGSLWHAKKLASGGAWTLTEILHGTSGNAATQTLSLQVLPTGFVNIINKSSTAITEVSNASGSWVNSAIGSGLNGSINTHAFIVNANGDKFLGYKNAASTSTYSFAIKPNGAGSWTTGGTILADGNTNVARYFSTMFDNSGHIVTMFDRLPAGGSCGVSNSREMWYAYTSVCTPPTVTSNPSNHTICNGNNTTFGITATGATGYQWQVNTGSGFNDITNGGVYSNATTSTLTITGATAGMNGYAYRCIAYNGTTACSTNSSAGTLTVTTITTSGAQSDISCNGGSNGAAAVTPSGGTTPYSYSWSPSGGSGAMASGLTAGSYTVTVTDNNGCTATRNYTISQPPALTASATSSTDVLCNGGSNGTASISAAGGTPGYSYNWTPGNPTGDGTASVSGLSAGTWTCTVTDANGCTASVNVVIGQPTALSASAASQTDVSCNGGSNGAASINTPTGGAGSYTYNWTPGNPTGDGTTSVTGLSAGTWTCTVTDANACTASVNFTITQATAINVSLSAQTDVACNGGTTGAATVTAASGGAGGYSYNWTPGNPTGDGTTAVTGLSAGTWTCTVTDANSCTAAVNATITQPTALNVSTQSVTNVACNGGSTGAASVNVTGGAGGYTYDWTPGTPTGDGTPSVSGLTAGTWTCTVTDANACTATQNITINESSAMTSSETHTNIVCSGTADGTATVSAAGGVTPYTYAWSPSGGSLATATGLAAGTYTCTVTDANGCQITQSATIADAPAWDITVTQANVSCNGGSDGTASVTNVTGGTAPYSYAWSDGSIGSTMSNVAAGTYTGWITDNNGCMQEIQVTITEPALLTFVTSETNISCNGASDGEATVTVSGGTSPYTYAWSPIGGSGATASGLPAGTYSCMITDANGCTATATVIITEPSALTGSISQTDANCPGGSDGSAEVLIAGGTTPYSYAWSPTGGSAATATGLTAGTYTCTITDDNGCVLTQTTTVSEPTAWTISATQTNVSCNGATDGDVALTVSGGLAPYSYAWSPINGSTNSLSGLAAGIYTCTITDDTGCSHTETVTITQPAALSGFTLSTNVSCNGGSNGTVTVNISGGTTPYTYAWSPIGGTGATASGLTAGTYTCLITDDHGCQYTRVATLTEPAALAATVNATEVSCHGSSDGGLQAQVSGGVAPYSYAWTPGNMSGANISGLVAGSYTLTVTDANGCQTTNTEVLADPAPVNTTVTQNSMTLTAQATGVTYQWINCTTNTPILGATHPTFSAGNVGTYAVVITDGICSDTSECFYLNNVGLTTNSLIEWDIYPNPATEQVQITFEGSTADLTVMDASGKVVWTGTVQPDQIIALQQLERGVYFFQLEVDGLSAMKRVVKQ